MRSDREVVERVVDLRDGADSFYLAGEAVLDEPTLLRRSRLDRPS